MDYGKIALVLCLVGVIVVGINAALYIGLANKSTINQIDLIRKAGKRASNPWKPEDADLMELKRRVEALKSKDNSEDEG